MVKGTAWGGIVLSIAALVACGKSQQADPVTRGRQVYLSNCTACHNPDPTKAGSQGPDIAGSSRELIDARVLHAAYPPGYKPKRTSHAMLALPYLAPKIDDLAAYLAAVGSEAKK